MYGDSYCGAYDMTVIIIVIIPIGKELGNIVIVEFLYTHTQTHGLCIIYIYILYYYVRSETAAAAAWSKYFILYLIGFLGTVYNLTAVIHTGPPRRDRSSLVLCIYIMCLCVCVCVYLWKSEPCRVHDDDTAHR